MEIIKSFLMGLFNYQIVTWFNVLKYSGANHVIHCSKHESNVSVNNVMFKLVIGGISSISSTTKDSIYY